MDFPNFDPVAIHLGPLMIRWYALAYLVGFLAGWRYGLYLVSLYKEGTCPNKTDIDDFIAWAVLGVIGGGRLGYILFYNFPQYAEHPLDIFKVWQGGMSFHGGLIGVITAAYIYCRKQNMNFLSVADLICSATPIGLFLGRLANFVNGELYGRVTDVAWGVVFPGGGELPRHASQLYEAALEGLILFGVLYIVARCTRFPEKIGRLSGVFLTGYFISRTVCELFREPDVQLGFFFNSITMGQILSLPMLLIGLYLIFRREKAKLEPA